MKSIDKEQVYNRCLEAISEEDFGYVLNNIQKVFSDEDGKLCDEDMCIAYLIYAEALMGVKIYKEELIYHNLEMAIKYSENVEDEELRGILEAYILIDYTKFYLDTNRYELAEPYAYEAICMCFSLDVSYEVLYSAITNFISVLNQINLYNNASIVRYMDILLFIDNMDIEFKSYEYDVVLKYLLFSCLYENNDYEQSREMFLTGYRKESVNDKSIYHTYNYVIRYKNCLENLIDGNSLREILLQIAYTTKDRIVNIVRCENIDEVLYCSKNITYILRLILSFEHRGVIKLEEKKLIEVIVNLKNILPEMLYIWKYCKEDKDVNWKWIEYNEICELIPSNTCYIDYVQFPYVLREETILADIVVMTIGIYNSGDKIEIIRQNPFLLLQERYLHLILNSSIRAKKDEGIAKSLFNFLNSESMPTTIYKLLIEKIDGIISPKCNKLIISGDLEITNIPFGALKDNCGEYLIDKYNIVGINSIRNYSSEENIYLMNLSNSFVLGNPEYTIDKSLLTQVGEGCLTPLPLSKIEANIVSEYLGVEAYTRKEANISNFVNTKCELLHIATHAQILEGNEEDKELDPLSYSCMYFAGANDYIITGEPREGYGTGKITAKEMCAYDFRNVKIAVLSMCFSGNGEIDYSQGIIGFKTVLLANNVRAIISCLWEADDFATAVLIRKMYEFAKNMKLSEALRKAQQYLKSVSLLELKNEGWFDDKLIKKVGLVAENMRKIAQGPDDAKIFCEEKYWAGYNIITN